MTEFAIHASEMTAGLPLPPTDSRHRRDVELLQRCVYDQVAPSACRLARLGSCNPQ